MTAFSSFFVSLIYMHGYVYGQILRKVYQIRICLEGMRSIGHGLEAIHQSMTFISKTGPKQSNDLVDCGVTLLLTAYAWHFHPDPHNFNWEDIIKIRNLLPHFRRVLLTIALCTGDPKYIRH